MESFSLGKIEGSRTERTKLEGGSKVKCGSQAAQHHRGMRGMEAEMPSQLRSLVSQTFFFLQSGCYVKWPGWSKKGNKGMQAQSGKGWRPRAKGGREKKRRNGIHEKG